MRNAMLKRLVLVTMSAGVAGAAVAAGGHALPFEYAPDTSNLPSVQRGAAYFMGYCSGCHSMKYLRYNRIGTDLQIPEDLLKANLMLTSDKPGDTIKSAMPAAAAKTWFGTEPPDLTLETRARGPSWVYSYLKSFYVDTTRPLGVNNAVLPGASMPHVLWELQGWQVKPATTSEHAGAEEGAAPASTRGDDGEHAAGGAHGANHTGLELAQKGTLSPQEYDKFVGDLVNFMAYAAEPGKAQRQSLGFKAIIYLILLMGLCYLLKKEFWKDVH